MLIAALADSHFDETSRFDECVRVHDWIVEDLAPYRPDLIVHAGDVYERRSTPRERAAVARFFQACAAIAPVVVVRGNHDQLRDLRLLERLEVDHPLTVVEDARVIHAGGAAVGCLAWPCAAYLAAAGADPGVEVQNIMRSFAAAFAEHDGPSVLAAHAMARGAKTSTGQPLVGVDLEIGVADLQLAGADVGIIGHVHRGQDLGPGMFYPGSPRRTAFGELEAKRYTLIHLDEKGTRLEHVETPARGMVLLEATHEPGRAAFPFRFHHSAELLEAYPMGERGRDWPTNLVAGAEVRFRYHVEPEQRAQAGEGAARLAALLKAEDLAHSVKLEPVVVPKTRARAPQVAAARSLFEKLGVLWEARGDVPDQKRADRLSRMLTELEEEHRNAS